MHSTLNTSARAPVVGAAVKSGIAMLRRSWIGTAFDCLGELFWFALIDLMVLWTATVLDSAGRGIPS